jgi:type VI secretion system protein ImpC
MPYGRRTDPIDAFDFEEFSRQSGLSGMLWGNPALLVALLAAQAWSKGGAAMKLGSVNVVGDLPVYVYHDADGDQVALPCTERLFTERQAAQVGSTGTIPVLSLRGRPEVRVAGFNSLAGTALAGRWAPVDIKPAQPSAPKQEAPALAATPAAAQAAPSDIKADQVDTPPAASSAKLPEATPVSTPTVPVDAETDKLDAPSDTRSAEPPAATAATAQAVPTEAGIDDLDALLASLSAEPPPAKPDETENDLDALLASLN